MPVENTIGGEANLDGGEQPFRHYSRKHSAIAWISQNLFDHVTYTVRHGLLRGMKRKGGLGWMPQFLSAESETKEHAFWRSLDLRGLVVYDVGAFQGLLTLFFARTCARVVSYEPNTKNHARLLENIRLNKLTNVTVRKLGLGASPESRQLVFDPLMSGGSSLEAEITHQIRSSNVRASTESIHITTLDQEVGETHLPPPDLIKIDVEGWEIEVLKGARNTITTYNPALFLEMHGATMKEKTRKVSEIITCLENAGYQEKIHHVETGAEITSNNASLAAQGHLYCRR